MKEKIITKNNIIDKFTIIFIVSLCICTIIKLFSKEDINIIENPIFNLSYITTFLSFTIIIIKYLGELFSSKTREKIFNLFFEEIEVPVESKKKK